jgi:hypothetical protein
MIEDDPARRELFCHMLEKRGWELSEAGRCRQALACVARGTGRR